jgi:hypothetical protein
MEIIPQISVAMVAAVVKSAGGQLAVAQAVTLESCVTQRHSRLESGQNWAAQVRRHAGVLAGGVTV